MFVWMMSFGLLHIFVTKLGMVMQYYELVCHADFFFHYLQGQSYSEGTHDQNMTVYSISSELLILLQPSLL